MDGTGKVLDIPNLGAGGDAMRDAGMRQVPSYALYGEDEAGQELDFLHCESIAARSRLHDFRIRPHRHEQLFQVLFLAAGRGAAIFDGAQASLSPPCLVTVPAAVVHGYHFSRDVEGLVVTLYQHRVDSILRASPDAARGLSGARVLRLDGQPEAAQVIASSLEAVDAEFAGRAAGRAAMMEAHLAIAWLAAHRVASTVPVAPARGKGGGQIARFRHLIDRDFRSRAPIAAYAGRLGVTETHLRRLCQAHLGATPLGVLNGRVVLEAKRLLVFTTLEIKEVAAALGFADHAYFSRFFRRETGLAPIAFRATRRMTGPAAAAPPAAGPRPLAETPPATGRTAA